MSGFPSASFRMASAATVQGFREPVVGFLMHASVLRRDGSKEGAYSK